jgi:hypothetical protein
MYSCQDSLLKENTNGVLVQKSFYKSKNDLKSGVTGIFGSLLDTFDNIGSARLQQVPQMAADIISTRGGSNKGPFREIDAFQVSTTNQTVFDNWMILYRGVIASNTVLKNAKSVDASKDFIAEMEGVAHFMRAYCYFRLVKEFGPIPLYTSSNPDPKAKRSSVSDVYKLIVKDLQFASDNLPDKGGFDNTQYPTKWAAKALLGRVYITMAGWPLKQTDKYKLAKKQAKEVINSGEYQLMSNFGAFFKLKNNQNPERIFSFQFCQSCGYGAHLTGNSNEPAVVGGWVDIYAELNFFKNFPSGPRKDATYLTRFKDGTKWYNSPLGHPYIKKWRDGTTWAGDGPSQYASSRAIPIIRYAHVLLLYAEAQDMADGSPDALAYECINKVRNRSDLPDLTPGLGKIAFRDSVIRERGWEFAGEFTRWDDLVRTNKVVWATKRRSPKDRQPRRDIANLPKKDWAWWPVPQQEIDNDPNLKQNPGYK